MRITAMLCGCAVLAGGCIASPFEPSKTDMPTLYQRTYQNGGEAILPPGAATHSSHGLPLIPFAGSGSGVVNVTATARSGVFTVNTRDAITVHGTSPNTLLHVRATADVGLPGGQQTDGVCQRANSGQFMPLLSFPGGPPATLETSPGGAGASDIEFGITNPFVPEGGSLDLMIRLVDVLPPGVPSIDLRTPCFTLQTR